MAPSQPTALMLASLNAYAGENIGPSKIVLLGCHNTSGTCYVRLDSGPFGASLGCATGPATEFRFDNRDTANGRRSYASFLAAKLSGKSVTVYLDGCTTQGFPQLQYFWIVDG